MCNTLFTSIELVSDNVIPKDLDTAVRILYDCTPSWISIDAENLQQSKINLINDRTHHLRKSSEMVSKKNESKPKQERRKEERQV